jgi:hypothetical protein
MSCEKNNSPANGPVFDSIPVSKPLVPLLNEISGIADSKVNPGYLWGHEDSGTPNQLQLIGHDGVVKKVIYLNGVTNRDWEDMAVADGQVYIAETGDNAQVYPGYSFYRFPEPSQNTDTVKNIETISFTYPDGPHDAEAFLVDPVTMDIFIITKADNPSRIYKITFPYGPTNSATLVGTIGYNGVVSAALSPDGGEIIVKTYTGLYYYKRTSSQSIAQALQNKYSVLKYVVEPQGEAISFARDNSGFYTLSEKGFANFVNLNFYQRTK